MFQLGGLSSLYLWVEALAIVRCCPSNLRLERTAPFGTAAQPLGRQAETRWKVELINALSVEGRHADQVLYT